MASRDNPGAASMLLTALLEGETRPLREVARTRLSVHYETDHPPVPVLTVCTPDAVRLPGSLVTGALPSSGDARVGGRRLSVGDTSWRVTRWWRPPRPVALGLPPDGSWSLLLSDGDAREVGLPLPDATYDGLRPASLVGNGPGLTPAGDDLLAGALVTAHATGDRRLPGWQRATREALAVHGTTAVSRALLHHALDGYATPELAGVVAGLCRGDDVTAATKALLAVGSTSGAALLAGVLHVLSTHKLEGAA